MRPRRISDGSFEGMEPYLDRAEAPGQWTVREVLCHLLFAPGFDPVALLRTFATTDLPVVEITPGVVAVTPERKAHDAAPVRGRARGPAAAGVRPPRDAE